MAGKSDNQRNTTMMAPGLSEEAKRAVGAAFDAMSNWRNEMASQTERHSGQVFDKMSTAAKAMGWPAEVVDATRQQMMTMQKMQLQMFDQVMDTWEEQLKNPNPAAAMQSMMSKLQQFPAPGGGFPGMGGMPGMGSMPGMGVNPMQFWMQAAEQWQKNWMTAMSYWANANASMTKPPAGNDPQGTQRKPNW